MGIALFFAIVTLSLKLASKKFLKLGKDSND